MSMISLQSKDETTLSLPSEIDPINPTACVAPNSEDNSLNQAFTSTNATDADQTEDVPSPTSTLFERVTTSWMIEPLTTQSESSSQVYPTTTPEESISNTDNAGITQSQIESNEQDESHDLYVKDIRSAVPSAISVCLLGLIIFLTVRRCLKVRAKSER